MEPIVKNEIRIDLVCGLIKDKWRKFLIVMSITSVVAYAIVCCIPRYYVVDVKLAPEYGDQSIGGNSSLSATASMFGVNLGSGGTDAIVPEFYPDIVQSTDFLVPVMETEVVTQDGNFKGTYGEYLLKREKYPWWSRLYAKVKSLFVSSPGQYSSEGDYKVDPFKLTMAESKLLERVSSSINCAVDEKTGVITLSVKAQDPLVAATMANMVKDELQNFMTRYRTNKNIKELEHAIAMCDTAYAEYLKVQKAYADYVDKHQGLSKKTYLVEEERLAGEMQNAFAIYNSLYQQRLLRESEVQKRTPAFTILQNATVPVKPSGPKRLVITVVFAIVSAVIYLVKLIIANRRKNKKQTIADVQE